MTFDADAAQPASEAASVVGAWFEQYVDVIHAYVCRRAGREVARDVTAETFRVALAQFDRYDSSLGHERAWLYGIASNLLRRHWRSEQRLLRSQHRSASSVSVVGDPLLAVEDRFDARRDVDRVLEAVALLDPDDRDVLLLTVWEGLTSAEVAAALGVPAGTVRSRLSRIRAHLRADQGASK
ncbi:MAG: sigma-70 family RNA polymerase sigma factor [Actinobacteria bacterium]|nr:sigma-70 family RNA polymerase sigma factor [Actinomycetota bacterium]